MGMYIIKINRVFSGRFPPDHINQEGFIKILNIISHES